MLEQKKNHPKEKSKLHPRNKHRERYDFEQLVVACPELQPFVKLNDYGDESIDFFNPEAVRNLNKALLKHHYGIENWEIPAGYLCPPVSGRADYIHYIADLLPEQSGKSSSQNKITCLDIGVGANCIYPVIGSTEYNWSFIGADIDPVAIESARHIVESNAVLKGKVELRLQSNPRNIFQGIIQRGERIDATICNPPFHRSPEEAQAGTMRKLRNLKQDKHPGLVLNFGGQSNELWCEGGEERFVSDMIFQSRQFANSCFWFSTLISKEVNLKAAYRILKKVEAFEVKTVPMGQGNKTSRILAWTFLNEDQQKKWIEQKRRD